MRPHETVNVFAIGEGIEQIFDYTTKQATQPVRVTVLFDVIVTEEGLGFAHKL
jgi:hypothetical protein